MTTIEHLRALGQETIQMIAGDYLLTLERMVIDGRKRNDPTLAVAISIEALGLLTAEVRKNREAVNALPALLDVIEAAREAVENGDLRDIEGGHRWIGPSHDSPDGLGQCSCGDDDCEIATLLDAIHRVRLALARLDGTL